MLEKERSISKPKKLSFIYLSSLPEWPICSVNCGWMEDAVKSQITNSKFHFFLLPLPDEWKEWNKTIAMEMG